MLFPFDQAWWIYGVFTLFVLAVLVLDLGVFHRRAHVVSVKEAGIWTVVWITVAGIANLAFWRWARHDLAERGMDVALADDAALEFLSGYITEKALAIDNIFVIAMLFSGLRIPAEFRHRVLFYGIIGAVALRAAFIAVGASLLRYHWVTLMAGIFLIATGVKMLLMRHHDVGGANATVLRLLRRLLPITDQLDGQRFFTRRDGARAATPLFVALVLIETSDVAFAIDSVPAIFALTDEPLIVFLSNILAMLGLRSMYFLLDGAMARFHLLKYSLACILIFVGLKMAWLNDLMGGKFPIGWSLAIIAALLAPGFASSALNRRAEETAKRPET
ncbi:MAG TPA: TerC/Alx family metal homeostasis membrane protein [Planctomycetota bacterium]|nr:TerC/Alx family metal homeostasis membrane protein [Planctomycetota bacterium]